jgi:hypothetical protein
VDVKCSLTCRETVGRKVVQVKEGGKKGDVVRL